MTVCLRESVPAALSAVYIVLSEVVHCYFMLFNWRRLLSAAPLSQSTFLNATMCHFAMDFLDYCILLICGGDSGAEICSIYVYVYIYVYIYNTNHQIM